MITRQFDAALWPVLGDRLAPLFRGRTPAAWSALFSGTDACVAPVLAFNEVLDEPHNTERDIFYDDGTGLQPRPAPRFSRTQPGTPTAPRIPGEDTEAVLKDWT